MILCDLNSIRTAKVTLANDRASVWHWPSDDYSDVLGEATSNGSNQKTIPSLGCAVSTL